MDSLLVKLTVFLAVSGLLLAVSWKPLRVVGSHGFYRFFAWEAMVLLLVLNVTEWFTDPLSPRQIASWTLLTASAVVAGLGFIQLRLAGRPGSDRRDAGLYSFEKTSSLVTTGIYRYVRHPLYASLIFLAWGALLKDMTWLTGGLAAVATVCLAATARAEEGENIRYFGPAYQQYMQRTSRFIPFVW